MVRLILLFRHIMTWSERLPDMPFVLAVCTDMNPFHSCLYQLYQFNKDVLKYRLLFNKIII